MWRRGKGAIALRRSRPKVPPGYDIQIGLAATDRRHIRIKAWLGGGAGQSYSTAATGATVRGRHLLQAGLDARTGAVTGEEWRARGGGVSKNHRSSRLGCALAAGAPRTGAGGGVAGRCGEEPPGL